MYNGQPYYDFEKCSGLPPIKQMSEPVDPCNNDPCCSVYNGQPYYDFEKCSGIPPLFRSGYYW